MVRPLPQRESDARKGWLSPFTAFPRDLEEFWNRTFSEWPGWGNGNALPSLDVSETDGAIEVTMDVPGMPAEDIDIQLHENSLTVTGTHKEEHEEKERSYHRVERRRGSFSRTIPLPCAVAEDKVQAKVKDGVLEIHLPKSDQAKKRKIKVDG